MPETCAHFTNPNRDTGGKVGFWGRWKTSSTKSGGFICELPPTQATADIRILVFFSWNDETTRICWGVWRVLPVLQVWPLKLSVVFPRRTWFVGGEFWGVFGTETSYDQIWAETVGFILCKRVVFEQVFVEFIVLELLWDLGGTPQNGRTVCLKSFKFQDQVLKKSFDFISVLFSISVPRGTSFSEHQNRNKTKLQIPKKKTISIARSPSNDGAEILD